MYHCMAHILFILFGFCCLFVLKEQQVYLFVQVQTSQTGGQPYSDTSLWSNCSCIIISYAKKFYDIGPSEPSSWIPDSFTRARS